MERVSKEEFRKSIIEYFETNSKRSISEAKKEITKRLKKDEFDNSIKVGNVRVFYTSNKKFAGGKQNGYGEGFYISNNTTDIRI
ncbi:MAG: hypothetical protein LBJ63_05245 [Prevotellaceae bacterium]|jgi:hypothetical protein|nr:hypothetical protein [Prevotellaceae bacterium]